MKNRIIPQRAPGAAHKGKRGSRVSMQSFLNLQKVRILAASIMVLTAGLAPSLWAQASPLSLADAVTMALQNDPSVQSSSWDWLAASAKADAARWRQMPSFSLSAGYQRLSDMPATTLEVPPYSFKLPASLTNAFTFAVNMQYQVFAGFRIREAAALADLQAQSKLVGIEMVKRSLMFEVRRAYWEAVRATRNRQTLQKNLELMKSSSLITAQQVAQGTATRADQLAADMRYNQADLDLGDAASLQNRAYLTLASLAGNASIALSLSPQPLDAPPPLALTSQPGDPVESGVGQPLEENDLVSKALARRPETRVSSLAIQMAEHGIKQAQAGLYPTVTLMGNYTLADPNQRVPFQTDPNAFTGTWALGLQLSYELGGLPANLAEVTGQAQALKKTQADAEKQRRTVVLDVRACIISLERARRDLTLTQGNVEQAAENLRVAQQRLSAGTANDLDVLTAQFNLLRANFAVTNREIDAQIASADLARAIALDQVR